MYNHNKAQQSKNRVHISWDILYIAITHQWLPQSMIHVFPEGPKMDKSPSDCKMSRRAHWYVCFTTPMYCFGICVVNSCVCIFWYHSVRLSTFPLFHSTIVDGVFCYNNLPDKQKYASFFKVLPGAFNKERAFLQIVLVIMIQRQNASSL